MWVLDYLNDLRADFRVFYRIDDIGGMEAIEFQRLAYRVGAYKGVLQARLSQESEDGGRHSQAQSNRNAVEVDGDRASLMQNKDLNNLIEFG